MLLVRYSNAPAVERQPEVTLVNWRIFELPAGTRHFCGFNAHGEGRGRVSTEIVRFDVETMTGVTQSGRVYRLDGERGEGNDVALVRDAWLVTHGIDPSVAVDVEPSAAVRRVN